MSNGNAKERTAKVNKVGEEVFPQASSTMTAVPEKDAAKLLADVEAAITHTKQEGVTGTTVQKETKFDPLAIPRKEYEFEAAFKRAGDLMVEAFENNVNRAQGALEQIKAIIAKVNEGVVAKAEHLATFERQMETLRTEAHAAFNKNMEPGQEKH